MPAYRGKTPGPGWTVLRNTAFSSPGGEWRRPDPARQLDRFAEAGNLLGCRLSRPPPVPVMYFVSSTQGTEPRTRRPTCRAYPRPSVLRGDDTRELDDRGLGRRVGDVRNSKPADARDGSDIGDRALALPLHMREHVLAGQEHALQIDVADPVPALLASLDRTADFDGPDIVVQHVDPAKCRDLLGPEPLPKERVLHALAHFPTNSHISFTC